MQCDSARTTVQRIFDLNNRRFSTDAKMTPERLVQLYEQNLTLNQRSEALTLSFCEKAFVIWDRALSDPVIQRCVLAQEAFRQDS